MSITAGTDAEAEGGARVVDESRARDSRAATDAIEAIATEAVERDETDAIETGEMREAMSWLNSSKKEGRATG